MKAKTRSRIRLSAEKVIPDLAAATRRLRLTQTLPIKAFGNLQLRPITPEDEPLMVPFHQALSEETIYSRYFEHISLESRVKHDRLLRICGNTAESFALVAAVPGTPKRTAAILAVGRLSRTDDPLAADFALLVNDKAQGHGIGSGGQAAGGSQAVVARVSAASSPPAAISGLVNTRYQSQKLPQAN